VTSTAPPLLTVADKMETPAPLEIKTPPMDWAAVPPTESVVPGPITTSYRFTDAPLSTVAFVPITLAKRVPPLDITIPEAVAPLSTSREPPPDTTAPVSAPPP
jgi:hypothetical protein